MLKIYLQNLSCLSQTTAQYYKRKFYYDSRDILGHNLLNHVSVSSKQTSYHCFMYATWTVNEIFCLSWEILIIQSEARTNWLIMVMYLWIVNYFCEMTVSSAVGLLIEKWQKYTRHVVFIYGEKLQQRERQARLKEKGKYEEYRKKANEQKKVYVIKIMLQKHRMQNNLKKWKK